MNWIQKIFRLQRKKHQFPEKRSEEISDIIDRMPMTFGRWLAVVVSILALFIIIFGWIIKYHDVVSGTIKINTNNFPIKLISNTYGKIILFKQPQDVVETDEYIAIIQNSAKTEDVKEIIVRINAFDPNNENLFKSNSFPEKVSLGELNTKYYSFLTSLKNRINYIYDNPYEQQLKAILEDIQWKKKLLEENDIVFNTAKEKLNIAKKWQDKDTTLINKNVISEFDLDNSKNEYLSILQNVQGLSRDITSLKMQIIEAENRYKQLEIEKYDKTKQIQLELLSAYHELKDNLKSWEQKYVFIAPFNGKVEFLDFLADNQFIESGKQLFSIIPEEDTPLGQMLLPSTGAGKVSVGSKVLIKLDNYPYREFGSIEGSVKSISLTTNEQIISQNTINFYLIIVELPQGLTTNYGETLNFKYEIVGSADIIVKERRLIQRLFDNLKYNTK